MTEPDTDLHAQWRSHAVETPPAALDDAIRAAAHRAVHAKPSALRARAPWPTWATFIAAASIGVIAIGVWQLQPRDVDEIRSVTSDVPARPSAPAAAAAPRARSEGAIVAAPAVREELQSSNTADARRAQETPKQETAMQETDRQASPPIGEEKRAVAVAKKRDIAADIAAPQSKAVAADREADAAASTPPEAATDRKTDAAAPVPPEAATNRKTEAAVAAPPEARKPSPFPASDATRADNAASPGAPAQLAGAPAAAPAAASGRSVAAPGVAPPPGTSRSMLAQTARPPTPSMAAEHRAEPGVASPAPHDKARSIADYVDMLHRERAEQRESDARATLAAMRAEYADADARLPEDLHAWAAKIAPLPK